MISLLVQPNGPNPSSRELFFSQKKNGWSPMLSWPGTFILVIYFIIIWFCNKEELIYINQPTKLKNKRDNALRVRWQSSPEYKYLPLALHIRLSFCPSMVEMEPPYLKIGGKIEL